jgi:hypothetical protein
VGIDVSGVFSTLMALRVDGKESGKCNTGVSIIINPDNECGHIDGKYSMGIIEIFKIRSLSGNGHGMTDISLCAMHNNSIVSGNAGIRDIFVLLQFNAFKRGGNISGNVCIGVAAHCKYFRVCGNIVGRHVIRVSEQLSSINCDGRSGSSSIVESETFNLLSVFGKTRGSFVRFVFVQISFSKHGGNISGSSLMLV